MATHPKDMFDDLPADLARVGAHRSPVKTSSGWVAFAWAALATGLLVGAGVLFISTFGGADADLGDDSSTPAPVSTVEPLTDPADIDKDRAITIGILDGTNVTDLGQTAYDALDKAGWPVEEPAEADKTDTKTTIVYYTDAANEDIARGLVEALGVGEIRLREDAELGASLRVLLGADYHDLTSTD